MMGFRLVLSTAAALLAIAALALESSAAEIGDGNGNRAARRGRFYTGQYGQYGGYYGQIGGHRYGTVPERNPFVNGSAYSYPGYYNNQTFWERVQTQRNYPVQY
jgi:hypothetical protein